MQCGSSAQEATKLGQVRCGAVCGWEPPQVPLQKFFPAVCAQHCQRRAVARALQVPCQVLNPSGPIECPKQHAEVTPETGVDLGWAAGPPMSVPVWRAGRHPRRKQIAHEPLPSPLVVSGWCGTTQLLGRDAAGHTFHELALRQAGLYGEAGAY